jgi:hypothetical protein
MAKRTTEDGEMDARQAKRERTVLRRGRVTRTVDVPCKRCGGAGGGPQWQYTGWTCYECRGSGRGVETRRVYLDAGDTALDERLTAIIDAAADAERKAHWAAGKAVRDARERESAHEDALVMDAEFDAARAVRFYGTIGERLRDVPCTVDFSYQTEGFYGISMLVLLRHGDAVFKAWGTGNTLWGWSRGDAVLLSGTIRAHETYRGVDQTVLTRVKLTEAPR